MLTQSTLQLMAAASEEQRPKSAIVDDAALLLEHFQLLRPQQEATEAMSGADAGPRLAARFESTLSQDIGMVDLSRAEFGRIGVRWRTMDEVAAGKGDRFCAGVHCTAKQPLVRLELPFGWRPSAVSVPSRASRVALIATVVCRRCAAKVVQARAVSSGLQKPPSPFVPASREKDAGQHSTARRKRPRRPARGDAPAREQAAAAATDDAPRTESQPPGKRVEGQATVLES